ncbi:proline-rich receptor-like protein kinase PERK2 [Oryza brachyantha]|uniref:proline-rich receptor-like protein kinase PERK2 n=1 Tax=Oryza brachyantha TaxID=4533 RepID=UPI001ADAECE6|nr:proline-rich receptor-like protein kinase PERK2 [Oryza brachyantha]
MPSSPSPPPPATSAVASTPRRRRGRRLVPSSAGGGSSFSASSSSSSSSASFSFFPPTSPSPFHRFLPSPLRASSVPFSWEHRPGIPKTPARAPRSSNSKLHKSAAAPPLPLPPSLLSTRAPDPYASAVVPADYAAAMPPGSGGGKLGLTAAPRKARRLARRRPRLAVDALAEWLSVLSLYRSCKRAAACFAAKPPAP